MTVDMGLGTALGQAVAKLILACAHDGTAIIPADEAQALFGYLERLRPLAEMLDRAAARGPQPGRPDDPADVAARLPPKWSQPLTGPVGEARDTLALAVQCLLEQWVPATHLVPLAARVVNSAELAALVDAVRVDERRHVAVAIEAAAPPMPGRGNAPLDGILAARAAYGAAARIAWDAQ